MLGEGTMAGAKQSTGQRERRVVSRSSLRALASLVVAIAALPSVVAAQSASVAAKPKTWPIGGLVTLSGSAGIGSFVPGEQNRPNVGSSLNLLVNFRPAPGLTLMLSQTINKTLADFAEDPFAPRKRNTTLDDTLLVASWTPMLKDDSPRVELSEAKKKALAAAAAVNPTLVTAAGAGKPLTLPGNIRVSFLGIVGLPTSRLSQFQTRYLNLIGAVSFSRSWKYVTVTYQPRFQKQLHRYSNPIVSQDGSNITALAREGGAEAIGEGLVATGQQNISYALRNALILSMPGPGNLSFQVFYFMLHQYRYYSAPLDEFSSEHAKAGRGRLDLQFGSVAANYVLPMSMVASFSVSTFSQPWSADNQTYRFPFFDFRSTSDNITSVGLSLTRSF
jgi:hypothetical protein